MSLDEKLNELSYEFKAQYTDMKDAVIKFFERKYKNAIFTIVIENERTLRLDLSYMNVNCELYANTVINDLENARNNLNKLTIIFNNELLTVQDILLNGNNED